MAINKFQNIVENVDKLDDCTEAKKSVRELLPEGTAIVQLTDYIEVGIQDSQDYQGKPRPPSAKAYIGVHIIGGVGKDLKGIRTPYCQFGEPVPLMGYYPIDISLSEKAKYFNIFKAFNYAGKARHFVELLGTIGLLKISVVKKDDGKCYNDYDLRTVTEPVKDVTEGTLHEAGKGGVLDTPEEDYKCFVWALPDKAQWDSIEIEGTYEYEDKGVKVTKSKNRYQEAIQNAHNFMDSPAECLLTGVSALPTPTGTDENIEVPDLDDDLPF